MRVRRHTGPSVRPERRRRWLVGIAWVGGAALAGYLVAAVFLYPAPILTNDQPVARVLELGEPEAMARLEAQGFRPRLEASETHPTAPRGTVIWQDPPPEVFLPPGAPVRITLSAGPSEMPIPDVRGLDGPLAQRILEAAGFRLGLPDSIAATVDRGVVVATRPAAGVGRLPGTPVSLVLSRGPPDMPVPDLLGLTRAEAQARLAQAGLRTGSVTVRFVPGTSDGIVVYQSPSSGTLIPREARVNLIFSKAER